MKIIPNHKLILRHFKVIPSNISSFHATKLLQIEAILNNKDVSFENFIEYEGPELEIRNSLKT